MRKAKYLVGPDGKHIKWSGVIGAVAKSLGVAKNKRVVAAELRRRHGRGPHSMVRDLIINHFKSLPGKSEFTEVTKKGNPKKTRSASVLGFPNIKRQSGSGWMPRDQYEGFYNSRAWREIRYLALKNTEGRCECCGASAQDGAVLHVDHIKPRSARPDLSLALDNLQVMCADCNIGKGAWDDTDWRGLTKLEN